MKTVDEYLRLPYTFETIRQEDGSVFIAVKELSGCMSCGGSIEEAYEMIKDAMESWISVALEDQDPIPEPEICSPKEYSGKFVVRTPQQLHKELVLKAAENEVSLNSFVVSLLSRRCGIIDAKNEIIQELLRGTCSGEDE